MGFLQGWLAAESQDRDAIRVKRIYIKINDGNIHDGLMFSQIMYWHGVDEYGNKRLRVYRDGYHWLAKRYEDWEEECCINAATARKCITRMKERGLIVTAVYKFEGNPTVHIRLDEEVLKSRILAFCPQRTDGNDTPSPICPVVSEPTAPPGHIDLRREDRTYTKTTPETSTETTLSPLTPQGEPEEREPAMSDKACFPTKPGGTVQPPATVFNSPEPLDQPTDPHEDSLSGAASLDSYEMNKDAQNETTNNPDSAVLTGCITVPSNGEVAKRVGATGGDVCGGAGNGVVTSSMGVHEGGITDEKLDNQPADSGYRGNQDSVSRAVGDGSSNRSTAGVPNRLTGRGSDTTAGVVTSTTTPTPIQTTYRERTAERFNRTVVRQPYEISAGVPDPEFVKWRSQHYLNKGGEWADAAIANAKSEIRNNPQRALDLWSDYQEHLAAEQKRSVIQSIPVAAQSVQKRLPSDFKKTENEALARLCFEVGRQKFTRQNDWHATWLEYAEKHHAELKAIINGVENGTINQAQPNPDFSQRQKKSGLKTATM